MTDSNIVPLFPEIAPEVVQVPVDVELPTPEEVAEALPVLLGFRPLAVSYDAVLDGIAGGAIDMTWGSKPVTWTMEVLDRKGYAIHRVVPKEKRRIVILRKHVDREVWWERWNGWARRWGLRSLVKV